jgi:hypothetical protein
MPGSHRLARSLRLFACLLALAACSGPARTDPGDSELKDDAGNTIIQYIPEVPQGLAAAGTTDPAKQVGLILVFPEHQHPTGEDLKSVNESLERLKLTSQYVVIAAHAQDPKGFFSRNDFAPIEKLLTWAKKTYPINPRRVYFFGRGEGAHISGEFAVFHPDLISAVTTYSWGWRANPEVIKDPDGTFPEFYTNLGQKEIPTHLAEVRATYARGKARGYKMIFREWPDFGAITLNPPSNDDALAWMTRTRNKNLAPSAEEAALLAKAGEHLINASDADFANIALVGGVPAGAVLQKLLGSTNEEVRATAAKTCAEGSYGEATVTALAMKLNDPSALVRQAVIDALAVQANWRSQAAQKALIAFVSPMNATADATDRLRAVQGMGRAMKLQAQGVQLDPPMFKALAALLDDDDEKIRTAAFAVLSPIRASSYNPAATKEERAPYVKEWAQWAIGVQVKEDSIPGPSR